MARRKVSHEEAWRDMRVVMARSRRNFLHRARPLVPEMLLRLHLHGTGHQVMTDDCYREHRAWIMRFFQEETRHERDAQENLPHLALVEP